MNRVWVPGGHALCQRFQVTAVRSEDSQTLFLGLWRRGFPVDRVPAAGGRLPCITFRASFEGWGLGRRGKPGCLPGWFGKTPKNSGLEAVSHPLLPSCNVSQGPEGCEGSQGHGAGRADEALDAGAPLSPSSWAPGSFLFSTQEEGLEGALFQAPASTWHP